MTRIINKPRISHGIGGMYLVVTVFMAVLYTTIAPSMLAAPVGAQILFSAVMIFAVLILIFTTVSLYSTQYVISDGVLHAWSPFATINLRLADIKSAEEAIVPVHMRVGAGLYCGQFYIPGLGWTKSIITNITDGVILTAKNGKHYLITPSDPDKFMKLLKKRRH